MMISLRRALSLSLVGLLAGCLALPTAPGTGAATNREKTVRGGLTSKKLTPKPIAADGVVAESFFGGKQGSGLISNNGGGLISNNGGGIVSNNSAGLVGRVTAPAGLISNNGGGLISNNGGGYRVLATGDAVLEGVTVELVGADGTALRNEKGELYAAVTDAEGKYRIPVSSNDVNLLTRVVLPQNKGMLLGFVGRENATSDRTVNLNLNSTLVMGYILSQYVKGDQSVLEKLPMNVEAQTRSKMAAAYNLGKVATPDALTGDKISQTVDALRRADAGIDDQMEVVKKLLVAAGLSDMGNGRPGTEVNLGYVQSLAIGPDGLAYFAAEGDRRVWRLNGNGTLAAVAGNGSPSGANLNGQPALEAALDNPRHLSFDAQGRLWIHEISEFFERLSRIESDGKLTQVTFGASNAVIPQSDGSAIAFARGIMNNPMTWKKVVAGQNATQLGSTNASDSRIVADSPRYGYDAQNRLYLARGTFEGWGPEDSRLFKEEALYRFDPANQSMTKLRDATTEGWLGMSVAIDGTLFFLDANRTLWAEKTNGTRLNLMDAMPADFTLSLDGCALAPDGTAYVAQRNARVYRIRYGRMALVAGKLPEQNQGGTDAANLSLQVPCGVVALADGTLFVADQGTHRVLRIGADKKTSVLAGTGETGFAGDGGPALQARFADVTSLERDADGRLYLIDLDRSDWTTRIRRIDPDGKVNSIYSTSKEITDIAVEANGTLYFVEHESPDAFVDHTSLQKLPLNATQPEVLIATSENKLYNGAALALGPNNTLMVMDFNDDVFAFGLADRSLTKLPISRTNAVRSLSSGVRSAGFSCDASGNLYFIDDYESETCVFRYKAASQSFERIAGKNGSHFSGTGVDDGVSQPGYLAFDPAGNFYFCDQGHKQIKRIPANEL